jgi:hypothetical protein
MQSHTLRWHPDCVRLAPGLGTRSDIQISSGCYRQCHFPSHWWNPICVSAWTRKVHVHSTYNSLATPDRVLGIWCQAFTLGPSPPQRCTMTNPSRSIKWIAQILRASRGQWLAKYYDLGWVVVLFVDEPRNFSSSSGSTIAWNMKHMIGDCKMLITIVWNPQDFHLIDELPKDRKFNASYDINMIL